MRNLKLLLLLFFSFFLFFNIINLVNGYNLKITSKNYTITFINKTTDNKTNVEIDFMKGDYLNKDMINLTFSLIKNIINSFINESNISNSSNLFKKLNILYDKFDKNLPDGEFPLYLIIYSQDNISGLNVSLNYTNILSNFNNSNDYNLTIIYYTSNPFEDNFKMYLNGSYGNFTLSKKTHVIYFDNNSIFKIKPNEKVNEFFTNNLNKTIYLFEGSFLFFFYNKTKIKNSINKKNLNKLYLNYNDWCLNKEISFKIYNLSNKREFVLSNITIYNGSYNNSKILFNKIGSANFSFKFKIKKDYLININPKNKNFSKLQIIFHPEFCNFSNNKNFSNYNVKINYKNFTLFFFNKSSNSLKNIKIYLKKFKTENFLNFTSYLINSTYGNYNNKYFENYFNNITKPNKIITLFFQIGTPDNFSKLNFNYNLTNILNDINFTKIKTFTFIFNPKLEYKIISKKNGTISDNLNNNLLFFYKNQSFLLNNSKNYKLKINISKKENVLSFSEILFIYDTNKNYIKNITNYKNNSKKNNSNKNYSSSKLNINQNSDFANNLNSNNSNFEMNKSNIKNNSTIILNSNKKNSDSLFLYILIFIIILIIFISSFYFIKIKNKKNNFIKKENINLITYPKNSENYLKIKNYVLTYKNNFSKEQIYNSLKNSNISDETIKDIFEEVYKI